jgi:hypothetical protein
MMDVRSWMTIALYAYICIVYLLKNNFFFKVISGKVNSKKVNYFLMFGSVMKNKLENSFQYLVMSWKMSWKITY